MYKPTQNKLTAKQIYAESTIFEPEKLDFNNNIVHKLLLSTAILTNDACFIDKKYTGDPIEIALIELAHKLNINEIDYRENHKRKGELPFDSKRKLMTTYHTFNEQSFLFTKGDIHVLIPRITSILTKNGARKATPEDIKSIEQTANSFSKKGLTVIALVFKIWKRVTYILPKDEINYTFIGLIALENK